MSDRPNKSREYEEIPPCMIYVDKDGKWFHKGAPIIRRDLLSLFYKSLDVDAHGHYIIRFKEQVCRLDVEDTPYVILATDFVPSHSRGEKDRLVLNLIDNSQEDLVPETLWIGREHVPYCKIRNGKFKARFSRDAYYQLARHLEEDTESGRYFLGLNHKKYYLKEIAP